jgi:cell division protease FtsH
MSIVKNNGTESRLSTHVYEWHADETLVQERQKLRYRIGRLLGPWRIALLVFTLLILLDANFARFFLQMLNGFNQALGQFQLSAEFIAQFVIGAVISLTIGIGQFAFLFWFLGRPRMYIIWPGTTSEGVSFKDYRGQPELLDQAKQIVKLLRGVRVFEESGGEPLNGLLLEGPPGTGKTWLAKAISTEANVPFFYLDASSLQSMFFGISPLMVSNLYRRARNAAKDYGAAIIFIDEIDAVGARGGVSTPGGRNSMEPEEPVPLNRNRMPIMYGMGGDMGILSTLLVEMSGFSLEHGFWARQKRWFYKTFLRRKPPKPQKRILTIGATNRIGALDPALLRPGRFDKKITVDAPDMEGRRDIFEYYLSKMSHDDSMDPLILAAETAYYTPADIKYLLNESLRYAVFAGRTYVVYEDFRMAQPEHEMGLRSPLKNQSLEDKYSTSAHEAGHAVAIRIYRPHYRISRITVLRQGGAYGHVSYYPAVEEYEYTQTYDSLLNRLRVAVAGKAAEMEFCGEGGQTLGVGGDFQHIRAVLNAMASSGMFGTLGISQPESDKVRKMKEEVFVMALSEVRMMLRLHRPMVEALIQQLMEKSELLAREVEAFFDEYGLYTPKIALNPGPSPEAAATEVQQ